LESGYYQKAQNFFNKTRINSPAYFEDATWYLAMTHLKQEQTSKTIVLLKELLDDKKGFYYSKSAKLIITLEK